MGHPSVLAHRAREDGARLGKGARLGAPGREGEIERAGRERPISPPGQEGKSKNRNAVQLWRHIMTSPTSAY